MRYLFINTAISVSSVALIENGVVKAIREEYNSNDLSSKIFFMIDQVFTESNSSPNELNKIFIVNGPGSFTGIRIGLTIAKTMAWALNIELIPISSLELLATSANDKPIISLIDARRGSVYAGGYDNKLQTIMPDVYMDLEELLKKFPLSKVKYVSYDTFSMIDAEKPVIDYIKIIQRHESDKVVSCHKVNPIYLKLTEAEEKRRQNEN